MFMLSCVCRSVCLAATCSCCLVFVDMSLWTSHVHIVFCLQICMSGRHVFMLPCVCRSVCLAATCSCCFVSVDLYVWPPRVHVVLCLQICMSGRHVFMGYLDMEEKTKEAIDKQGLLHSGDIGRKDENGFIYITGRIKGIIGSVIVPPFVSLSLDKQPGPVASSFPILFAIRSLELPPIS